MPVGAGLVGGSSAATLQWHEWVYVLLTAIFWVLLFLPGYACLRDRLPGFGFLARALSPGPGAALHNLAYGYAFSFLLLSPVSLLCYVLGAPLWVFSAALCGWVALSLFGLWQRARAAAGSSGSLRLSLPQLRVAALLPYCLLFGLLWLQTRLGGWLDGDATFHLGRIRVLLEHGFTNRDIYLHDYHFQHTYHSNLLFPVYASAAQLTGLSYLQTWFYSEAWAKLMVASGHFVLGYALTRRTYVGYALAVCVVTLNAGETYTLYPNTLCVGYLLPMLLGLGFRSVNLPQHQLLRSLLLIAALSFVVAQLHSLYVIYAGLTLTPPVLVASLRPGPLRMRLLRLGVLAAFATAAPFVLVSMFGFQSSDVIESAPEDLEPPELAPPPTAGIAPSKPPRRVAPALAAGGGHLEKMLESVDSGQVVFDPRRMGGALQVTAGGVALLLCVFLYRTRRLPLAAASLAALWLAAILFTRTGATWGWKVLQAPFVVARLSTILTTLLTLGACALTLWPVRCARGGRRSIEVLLLLLLWAGASQLLGHAPKSFRGHVQAALAPREQRHALLDRWLARRQMLVQTVPAGSTVLTTPRFARYVVMLCDCYVLAADRGHTHVSGMDKRRRDVTFMNSWDAPWDERLALIQHYGVRLVTFERRWKRRYSWTYQHGKLLGHSAGQDVIELNLP